MMTKNIAAIQSLYGKSILIGIAGLASIALLAAPQAAGATGTAISEIDAGAPSATTRPADLTLGITFDAVSIRPTSPGISHITGPPDGITVGHSTMLEILWRR
jgi:hypothetical protein